VIQKRNSGSSVVTLGNVRVNDFAQPLQVGLQLAAPPYPVSYSPASLGAIAANGWTGNNTSGLADQLWRFNDASGAFVQYYLRADGISWRQVGGLTDVAASELFGSNSVIMINRKTADPAYVLVYPGS
jgi:hypothetical protein